jgi:hypothetical protein
METDALFLGNRIPFLDELVFYFTLIIDLREDQKLCRTIPILPHRYQVLFSFDPSVESILNCCFSSCYMVDVERLLIRIVFLVKTTDRPHMGTSMHLCFTLETVSDTEGLC